MTRRLLPLLLLTAVLAGCGGTSETAAPASTTAAAPTSAATAAYTPGADADADAAATAWTTVFDSSVPADAKTQYLADPTGADTVLAAYATIGQQVGGIVLKPTAVRIDGDAATVTYDITFAGNPAYSGLDGTLQRGGSGWQIGKDQFCAFMAQARTTCP